MTSKPQPLLCWTVCAYRKPGLSEADYHKHMSEIHGPLVKHLMVKYGFVSWSMTHNTSETRELMKQLVGPQFEGSADYDCIVQCAFRDVGDFVRMKKDPLYLEQVMPDHERFADTKRSKMTVGWIEDHVRDGKVVE
ncbi:MAG: hypothetical protein ASARMPREDX12_008593 [Alectoria sarmentosa]|nr:MAG: hypothetical protein ASARMPREDX12_008593 [Alectoria sarmentosa]